jgi:diadenosine tetraphosphate (Ap4A) HIT family hydrolase
MKSPDCQICQGADGDSELLREQTWEDELWRLSTATCGEVAGFSYLEPKRHISDITALDGQEAETLGPVIARVSAPLRRAAGAELVYVYVFGGGVPHLHIHLAPHRDGDALSTAMIRGEFTITEFPSGAQQFVSKDYPQLPERQHRQLLRALRADLGQVP